MVTVKVILVNPIDRNSTGTTNPGTSASNGHASLGLIICHLPWESQKRPSFQNPIVNFPHQRFPALALGAQINFLLFQSALSEVQPVPLQSVVDYIFLGHVCVCEIYFLLVNWSMHFSIK